MVQQQTESWSQSQIGWGLGRRQRSKGFGEAAVVVNRRNAQRLPNRPEVRQPVVRPYLGLSLGNGQLPHLSWTKARILILAAEERAAGTITLLHVRLVVVLCPLSSHCDALGVGSGGSASSSSMALTCLCANQTHTAPRRESVLEHQLPVSSRQSAVGIEATIAQSPWPWPWPIPRLEQIIRCNS